MTGESSPAPGWKAVDPPTAAAIERWLVEHLAEELKLPPERIDRNQPIAAYGVDSMQVVALLARLEDWLGFRFSSNPLDDHPTVAALSRFAESRANQAHR